MSNKMEIPEHKGERIDLEAHGIQYGFRHDPMEWVMADRSPGAARLRTQVFRAPRADDKALIDVERRWERELGDAKTPRKRFSASARVRALRAAMQHRRTKRVDGYLLLMAVRELARAEACA